MNVLSEGHVGKTIAQERITVFWVSCNDMVDISPKTAGNPQNRGFYSQEMVGDHLWGSYDVIHAAPLVTYNLSILVGNTIGTHSPTNLSPVPKGIWSQVTVVWSQFIIVREGVAITPDVILSAERDCVGLQPLIR